MISARRNTPSRYRALLSQTEDGLIFLIFLIFRPRSATGREPFASFP
jgi:hypothetical protein